MLLETAKLLCCPLKLYWPSNNGKPYAFLFIYGLMLEILYVSLHPYANTLSFLTEINILRYFVFFLTVAVY
jgi:hypothetical protein